MKLVDNYDLADYYAKTRCEEVRADVNLSWLASTPESKIIS